MAIGIEILGVFDQVARHQQQRRPLLHLVQLVDDHVQPAHVHFVRIVAVEADVQVGYLRHQDAVD
jgi:hypothetical protein